MLKIEIDAGRGNLNAKAYVAAVVGPYRLAHGSQKSLVLTAGTPMLVAKNPGVAGTDQAMFVGVALQPGNAPVTVLFGPGDQLGNSSNVPAKMDTAVAQLGGISFSSVLLPGDELWVVSDVATSLVSFSVGF
jgi:hypothetical protein